MHKGQGRQHRGDHRPRAARIVKVGFFAVLALGVLALGACDHSGPMQSNSTAWEWRGDVTPAGTVNVRNTMGAITVEPSADNQVHVVAATQWSKGDWRKDLDFQVVSVGNTVTICAIWNRGTCTAEKYDSRAKRGAFHSDAKVAFTVQVPAGVKVDAWTMSGDVNVRAAAPVKARTIDGDIRVGTAVGPVNAETINGDVDVRMTTIGDDGGPVRAVTKNGDAAAWVPEIADGRIEASTINGAIGSDFGDLIQGGGDRRSFATSLGTGSRQYSVQSLNGSAYLRLINADGSVPGAGFTTTNGARAKAITLIEEPRPRRPELKNPR